MFKEPLPEQQIIKILKNYYGIDIQSAQLYSGGADMEAFAYKADGKLNSYFVKIKHAQHDEISLSIINLLQNSGVKEIIFPLYTVSGKLFESLDGFKIIVYPFVNAPNGFKQTLTQKQWIQLGQAIRKIHETSVPSSLQQQLRKETYSIKWREMAKSFYNKIDPQKSDDKITLDFKLFFKKNSDKIFQLVNVAEELSKKLQPDLNKYVLCHSDIHAGNVLIQNCDSIYIIDWDEPMMAPKERDLMFIGGGVGNVWNKSQEVSCFYKGYGETNIDRTTLAYYRHERIVEDIAVYGRDLLSRDQNDQSRFQMFKYLIAMFDPNGVVDIAFDK
jgi:spectinomycin phosphotransferase